MPERLVCEARLALGDYPSGLEIEDAADGQRSMHTWMARAAQSEEFSMGVHARLQVAVVEIQDEAAMDHLAFDSQWFLDEWLFNEHPALGYREPIVQISMTSDPEMLVQLFRAEGSVLLEARRVFQSERMAYRWLRHVNCRLKAIPLEMLGSEAGRLRVMDELRRLAAEFGASK